MHPSSQIVHHKTIQEQPEIQENLHNIYKESSHFIQDASMDCVTHTHKQINMHTKNNMTCHAHHHSSWVAAINIQK